MKKGDTILIVAPAGYVERKGVQKTIDFIESNGWKYEISKNTFNKYYFGYNYSGTAEERLEDFQWALNHPTAKAIWFARGGYGGVHLIDSIKLKKFKKNPKWLIGYSDNTIFHQHFNKRGFNTLHATVGNYPSDGCSEETYSEMKNVLEGKKLKYEINSNIHNESGKTEGIISGGNLSLINSLIGSKSIDKFKNKILFIEDIGENHYAVDRMLCALKRAKVFKGIKGLIVGGMINMDEKENKDYENSFNPETYEVIAHNFKEFKIPKIFAFPSGHVFDNRPIIMGGKVEMNVQEDKVSFTNWSKEFKDDD